MLTQITARRVTRLLKLNGMFYVVLTSSLPCLPSSLKLILWYCVVMWQSVPQSLLVAHELASMTLEYRRECTPSDVVQSLSCPDTHLSLNPFMSEMPLPHGGLDGSPDAVSCHSGALKSATISPTTTEPKLYTHLLRMQSSGADIVMGRTKWRVKDRYVGAHWRRIKASIVDCIFCKNHFLWASKYPGPVSWIYLH